MQLFKNIVQLFENIVKLFKNIVQSFKNILQLSYEYANIVHIYILQYCFHTSFIQGFKFLQIRPKCQLERSTVTEQAIELLTLLNISNEI